MSGLPGLAGTDLVGFTVPDMEAATRFFVDVIGCSLVYEIGPFVSDDDWMQVQLGVNPRSVIKSLRMFRCGNGSNFELFEYQLDGATQKPSPNSDVGAAHLGFYVKDIEAAFAYLKEQGLTVQGDIVKMDGGPSERMSWVYFLSPWGMQLELVSYPKGIAVLDDAPGALWSSVVG